MIALNLLVFGQVYAGTAFLYSRDILTNYVPNGAWFASRVLSGEIPLWNDRILGGMPFWGDPVQAVLYPGRILQLLLSPLHPVHSYGIFAGLHFLVAQAGFRKLLQRLGCRSWIAFAGSAAVAYSPAALMLHTAIQFLCGFAWLGWAGAAVLDHLGRPDRRTVLRLSLWTVLLVTAGDLQAAWLFGAVTLLACRPWVRESRQLAIQAGFAFVLAGFMSAAVIIPGAELSLNSSRRFINTPEQAQNWSWNPVRTAEWFIPGLFDPPESAAIDTGALSRPVVPGQGLYFPRASAGLFAFCLLPLAIMGAVTSRMVRWLLAISVAALIMAAGEYAGLYRLAYEVLPGWNQFRFPERLFLHFTVALTLAVALTLERFLRGELSPGGRLLLWSWMLPAVLVPATGYVSSGGFWPELAGIEIFPAYLEHVRTASLEGLLFAALAAVAFGMLMVRRAQAVPWLFGILVAAEIAIVSLPVLRTASPELFPLPMPLVTELPDDTGAVPLRLHVDADMVFRGENSRMLRAAYDWRRLVGDLVMLTPWSIPGGYNSSRPLDHDLATRIIPGMTGLRLQSVSLYLAGPDRVPGPESGFLCDLQLKAFPASICGLPSALPAARAPARWDYPGTVDALKERLSDPSWDPRLIEYIGRLSGGDVPPRSGSELSAPAEITISRWSPELKRIELDRNDPGPVVLRDNFFSGWKAYVNGRETPVFAANGFQLAAWTPAGRSTLEFRYQPWTVTAGLLVTVVTFLGVLGAAWRSRQDAD